MVKGDSLAHHHLLLHGIAQRKLVSGSEEELKTFLLKLVKKLEMKTLIPPTVVLSNKNAYTGIIGIVSSHISFHFWLDDGQLQLDIYSCKNFNKNEAIAFIKKWWQITKYNALFIKRDFNKDFEITEMHGD